MRQWVLSIWAPLACYQGTSGTDSSKYYMHSSANLPNVQLSFWNNLPSCSSTPTLFMDMAVDLFFLVQLPLPSHSRRRSGGGGASRFLSRHLDMRIFELITLLPEYLLLHCLVAVMMQYT
jgi:hypothetical protein